MTPHIVIPAAGASARMRGRDKLAERVDGVPLLTRQVASALKTGAPVTVCLPPDGSRAHLVAEFPDLRIILIEDAAEGLGASLRAAAVGMGENPMAILLPDVPGVNTRDILDVFRAFGAKGSNTVVRASDPDGRPGTPIVMPPRLLPAFAQLEGDDGGRSIIRNEHVHLVHFPDDRATRDLDTPEEWEDWRADR